MQQCILYIYHTPCLHATFWLGVDPEMSYGEAQIASGPNPSGSNTPGQKAVGKFASEIQCNHAQESYLIFTCNNFFKAVGFQVFLWDDLIHYMEGTPSPRHSISTEYELPLHFFPEFQLGAACTLSGETRECDVKWHLVVRVTRVTGM